jgi:uncharacterized protein YuzE
MKIEFDPVADALYIDLQSGEVEKTTEISPGIMLDFDAAGNVLGLEMLYVSKRERESMKQAA